MAVTITHTTPADGTFSATGAAAWDANHAVSGLGTMAEQDANNVNITGGSITGVTGVLTGLTVGTTATSGGAAGQIMFDTGSVLQESSNLVWNNTNGGLTVSSVANPTIPSLTINGASSFTGATLSGVSIAGTGGQFSCNSTTLTVGELVTISGTLGGTGSITGYANPTTYRISATNGTTTFTLVNNTTGAAIVTTAGTPTGLTYTVTDPFINLSQTWNNSVVAFTGLRYNVTNTASAAASLLMDLQVGGTSQFNIGYNGTNPVLNIKSTTSTVYNVAGSSAQLLFYFNGTTANTGFSFDFGGNQFYVRSTIGFGTNGQSGDLFLTRRGAANLRLGAADAAAPVAQTLSVQSVVAGTSNTAGANLTITGSQGTGTGAGGSIIFQVAPAGSSGTAQNALTSVLQISAANRVTAATGEFDNAGYLSLFTNTASAIARTVTNRTMLFNIANSVFNISGNGRIGFASNTAGSGDVGENSDTLLTRRGAANLRLGAADAAAPVAQTLSVQSVVAGTTNTAGANLTITGSQGTGTGAGGSIIFRVAPAGSSGTAQNSLVTLLEATSTRALNFYNTADTTTNFERFVVDWNSNVARIGVQAGGTGSTRALRIGAFDIGAGNSTLGTPITLGLYSGKLQLYDINLEVGTATGTKIGTATSQKLGFWNATPIVQPTTAVAEATFVENAGGTAVNVDSTFDGYTLQQVVKALRNAGLLA